MGAGDKEYKCFIVDDNIIDRMIAVSFIKKYSFLKISGIFSDATSALEAAFDNPPDLLLLDINMQGITGLELRSQLQKVAACIFVTSYPDFALSGFELNALDYLIKPLEAERFDLAMKRLEYYLNIRGQAELLTHSLEPDFIYIKEGHTQYKIRLNDILYLEALRDYTGVVTREKKYCILTSLGSLLQEKKFLGFIRIHRSYAVQKRSIVKIGSAEVTVGEIVLPIGRIYREGIQTLLTD